MKRIIMPTPPDFNQWRETARAAMLEYLQPHEILWETEDQQQQDLFAAPPDSNPLTTKLTATPLESKTTKNRKALKIPRKFHDLSKIAICHSNNEKYPLLYRLIWRLVNERKNLLNLTTDKDVIDLNKLVKEVRRDSYKITAFLRFREINEAGESRYIAWYEPEHYSLERVMDFFTTRFTNMAWSILTPYRAAHWDGQNLTMTDAPDKTEYPKEDELEPYWLKYYASTFNPARPKKSAMLNQMPMKYWKNMPETHLIPELLQKAESRAKDMIKKSRHNTLRAP